MNSYFEDYITVAAFAGLGIVLVAVSLGISSLIRPNKPNKGKRTIYECGMDPVGGGWSQTHIRYYIFALLFLIFDVEAVFIFPWAVRLEDFANAGMGGFVLGEMIIFILILVLGLLYAIRKRVLQWQ